MISRFCTRRAQDAQIGKTVANSLPLPMMTSAIRSETITPNREIPWRKPLAIAQIGFNSSIPNQTNARFCRSQDHLSAISRIPYLSQIRCTWPICLEERCTSSSLNWLSYEGGYALNTNFIDFLLKFLCSQNHILTKRVATVLVPIRLFNVDNVGNREIINVMNEFLTTELAPALLPW